MVEVFVVRVFAGGKVTIPKRVRDLLDIEDGDYVRLSLVEVVKRAERRERESGEAKIKPT